MDFDLSDDQKLLVDTVRSFCAKESPVIRARKLREDHRGWSPETWKKMGDLGWLSVAFPEAVGGLGGSFVDLALIIEHFGATLVPEPVLGSVVLGGMTLLEAGNAAQHERWLTPMLEGRESLAFAYAETDSRSNPLHVETRAETVPGGYRLTGKKRFVLNGHAADHVIVSARTSGAVGARDGLNLFVVDPGMKGLSVETVQCMDGQKAAMVDLAGVEVDAERRLGGTGSVADLLEKVMDLGAAAACAEGAGLMQAVLLMTRNYICEREQFGHKIGSFQALQHRCVDMFVETELAKSTAILAMLKAGEPDPDERARAISVAKVQLAQGGGFVVREGTQLHGGIGVTDEHDIGLYFKRMHVLNTLFGDGTYHTERFARLPSFTKHVGAA